jgi:hypothetical protein
MDVRISTLHSPRPNKPTWNFTQFGGTRLVTEAENDGISTLVSFLKLAEGECFVHFIMKSEEILGYESVIWRTDVILADKGR